MQGAGFRGSRFSNEGSSRARAQQLVDLGLATVAWYRATEARKVSEPKIREEIQDLGERLRFFRA